jgi:hypothetical protein
MTDEYFWISSESKSGVTKHFLVETISEYERGQYRYVDTPVKKTPVSSFYVEERKALETNLNRALKALEHSRITKDDLANIVRSVTIAHLVAEINKTLKELDVRYQNTNPQLVELSEARFGDVVTKYFLDLRTRCLELDKNGGQGSPSTPAPK